MGRKRIPGLLKRGNTWHIDKKVGSIRVRESAGTDQLEEAERYLARRIETIRQARVYGVRPKRVFREAATKYLLENQHKRSIKSDAGRLKSLEPFIGDALLETIHMGTLQTYIQARRKEGVKTRTINHGLKIVRRILNLASGEWMDEYGLTWLVSAPKIKELPELDARKPYPLDWAEQESLFSTLAPHLQPMALFKVNTGCREREVCQLQWAWEIKVSVAEMGSVFVIPGAYTKNGEDRLVILNRTARAVVDAQRGKHPEFVFLYDGKPICRMNNKGWRRARSEIDLAVRVHDLKHTFGRRLRSAGVSFEDRQDLLGHKSARITTHYSSAELLNLWQAANKVCEKAKNSLTLLRTVATNGCSTKSPQSLFAVPQEKVAVGL